MILAHVTADDVNIVFTNEDWVWRGDPIAKVLNTLQFEQWEGYQGFIHVLSAQDAERRMKRMGFKNVVADWREGEGHDENGEAKIF